MSIIQWIQLAGLIIEYGFKLVKYFLEKYDKIEEESKVVVMSSDDKAKAFNARAANEIQFAQNRPPARAELNTVRETVWKAKNPGKTPKELADPKLRVPRRSGKTARRASG